MNQVFRRRSLEHIAAHAGVERLLEIGPVLVQREDHDANARHLVGQAAGEQDAVELRHGNVDHRHVRPRLADEPQRGRAVGGVADELEIALRRDQVAQSGEDDRMVVGEDDPDRGAHATILSDSIGMRANIVVPAPADDFDLDLAADQRQTLAHAGEAQSAAVPRRARQRGGIKAAARCPR